MSLHIKYFIVTILFILILSNCVNTSEPRFNLKQDRYYFSAGFENKGINFYANERIYSREEFKNRKDRFKKNYPNFDRYYYKVETQKDKKVIYAYSLLTHKLMEISISDKKHRLIKNKQLSDTNDTIECTRTYTEKPKYMSSQEVCTNDKIFVRNYILNTSYNVYSHRETFYYKNKKLINKYIYNRDGTLLVLNAEGVLQKNGRWMAESDVTPMFKK